MEDRLPLIVDKEGIHRAPLVLREKVLNFVESGIYTHHSYSPETHNENYNCVHAMITWVTCKVSHFKLSETQAPL